MCGIVGVFGNRITKDTHRKLFNLYYNQRERGLDGAGALIKNADGIERLRTLSPSRLFAYYNTAFWQRATDGSIILMHHRYPTSTPNKSKCNHPIANEDKTIYIIHNGVMSNGIKDLDHNHTFETTDGKDFTDSEVIVHILEELAHRYGSMERAIIKLPDKLKGSYAIAIVHTGEHRIYLLKNYMPIVVSKDEAGNFYFSSTQKDQTNFTEVKTLKTDEVGYIDSTGYHCLKEGYTFEAKDKITEKVEQQPKWWDNDYKWQGIENAQEGISGFSHYNYGFGAW